MKKTDYIYNAKIINVVDGDTIDLDIDLGFYSHTMQRIRLSGLDTKELNSKDEAERELAKTAKAFVEQFNGREATIKSFKQDKYGRFLGEVFVDGVSINAELLNKNLAIVYHGEKRV
jgi:micrococcal nuclease